MSLSFVSKSIQTSTDDGGFEERPIDNGPDQQGSDDGVVDSRPLFEQLRQNKERFDAEQEEYQRSLMRGTLALDEEDAAHLAALHRQRARDEATRQEQTARELAAFRAARADRLESTEEVLPLPSSAVGLSSAEAAAGMETLSTNTKAIAVKPQPAAAVLPVIVKRKRRRTSEEESSGATAKDNLAQQKQAKATGAGDESSAGHHGDEASDLEAPSGSTGGIGGLLVGYDSSSDDD